MPNIAVTPEQLQSVGAQLNAGAANIESTLSQLAGQVAPLQSEWQGVAQARFQELWAEWQRSSRGIQEALHGISQLTPAGRRQLRADRAGHRLELPLEGFHAHVDHRSRIARPVDVRPVRTLLEEREHLVDAEVGGGQRAVVRLAHLVGAAAWPTAGGRSRAGAARSARRGTGSCRARAGRCRGRP